MESVPDHHARRSLVLFWILCAIYVVVLGLVIQLFLLPRFFPTWDRGDGLLVRTDSWTFHRLAVELADQVGSQGWAAWELRPNGEAPAGLAAAIYALTCPKPWVLLPINAVMHATGAVLLVVMIQRLVRDNRWALVGALPFVLFPSALRWTTQIHKDGATILGFYMFACALLILASPTSWHPRWRPGLWALLLGFAGVSLVWVYRPYMSLMVQLVGLAAMVIVGHRLLLAAHERALPVSRAWVAVALVGGLLVSLTVLTRAGTGTAGMNDDQVSPGSAGAVHRVAWESQPWMPKPLDTIFRSLANRRQMYIESYPEAGSNVDVRVEFRDYTDVLVYIPRASEIGLLAPFPSTWMGAGTLPSTTLMRRAAIPEMIVIYLALLVLPLAIWRWRRKADLWILLVLCLGMLVGYALVVANVGTLYRMRYPYIMLLVGLSVAAAASWIEQVLRDRRTRRADPAGPPGR